MALASAAAVARHPHLAAAVGPGRVRVDLHTHTMWSGDSTTTPEEFAAELARTVAGFRASHPEIVYEGMGVSLPGRADAAGRLVLPRLTPYVPHQIRVDVDALPPDAEIVRDRETAVPSNSIP